MRLWRHWQGTINWHCVTATRCQDITNRVTGEWGSRSVCQGRSRVERHSFWARIYMDRDMQKSEDALRTLWLLWSINRDRQIPLEWTERTSTKSGFITGHCLALYGHQHSICACINPNVPSNVECAVRGGRGNEETARYFFFDCP